MGSFDVTAYNNIPSIADANARFEEQLAAAGLTREQLFSELAPLFLDPPYAGRYAACLIHRHYPLNSGERMVTTDLSTNPSTDTSPKIVAERWSSSGEEIEHLLTDDITSLPPPPPVDFLAKFNVVLGSHGIDVLGVCYAPEKLADGFMFLESDGLADRERVTAAVHRSARGGNSYDVTWLAGVNPDGSSCTMIVAGCCNGTGCIKPPSKERTIQARWGATGHQL